LLTILIPGVWEELLLCDPIVGASFLFVAAIGMSEELLLLLLVAEVPLFLESSVVVVALEELPCSRMEAGVLSSVGGGSMAVVDVLFLDRRWFEEAIVAAPLLVEELSSLDGMTRGTTREEILLDSSMTTSLEEGSSFFDATGRSAAVTLLWEEFFPDNG
jgi:hypothetical protein